MRRPGRQILGLETCSFGHPPPPPFLRKVRFAKGLGGYREIWWRLFLRRGKAGGVRYSRRRGPGWGGWGLEAAAAAEDEVEQDDDQDKVNDAAAVVAGAGTHVVAATAEEQDEDNEEDDHAGECST